MLSQYGCNYTLDMRVQIVEELSKAENAVVIGTSWIEALALY